MTPTSASTTERRTRGFTLLEILLVSALLALFASIALPLVNRQGNPRDFDWQAERLRDTVQRLNENSLFRGEMLALRLTDNGYLPLRYDPDAGAFTVADTRGPLGEFELPEGISLEWEVDEVENDNGDAVGLSEAAGQRLIGNDTDVELGAADEAGMLDLEDRPPQLFFFPSGETTPVTLTLVDEETGAERQLMVNAMGRVALDDEADDA